MSEEKHALGRPEDELFAAVEGLKGDAFHRSGLLERRKAFFFRYAMILTDPEELKLAGLTSGASTRLNRQRTTDANVVLRTIRNALAHGNVVYLNSEGFETAGNRLVYLAFLCENRGSKGYRAAIFTEESFPRISKRMDRLA